MEKQIKGNLTTLKLKIWVDQELPKLVGDGWEVVAVKTTRYSKDQYESGACKIIFKVANRENRTIYELLLCFYSVAELRQHIALGYELWLRVRTSGGEVFSISNIELDLRKPRKLAEYEEA